MKKRYSILIAFSLFFMAGELKAQTSGEGKAFAKHWLRSNCVEAAENPDEAANFIKYQVELKAYFVSAIQRGLELDEMREEEVALEQTYDQNLRMLNESKPTWITPEQEKKLRAVSKEVFVAEAKETLAQSYKARALKGLELLHSLPSR
ncbi:MAG: hypothetical protein QOI07_2979 [Verrucomicrobiota bacterium]|jgi:hypothetical protein